MSHPTRFLGIFVHVFLFVFGLVILQLRFASFLKNTNKRGGHHSTTSIPN